jgi:hypothetical protein
VSKYQPIITDATLTGHMIHCEDCGRVTNICGHQQARTRCPTCGLMVCRRCWEGLHRLIAESCCGSVSCERTDIDAQGGDVVTDYGCRTAT